MVKNLLEGFDRRRDFFCSLLLFCSCQGTEEKAGKPIVVDHALVENAI